VRHKERGRTGDKEIRLPKLTTIGFDADDTLWHNERFFRMTQDRFADLLREYCEPDHLMERLLEAEKRNISHYGFGIKGFVLSMIETALDVTEERVPGHVIRALVDAGQDMLQHPIELLPHAQRAVEAVAETHRVLLITKGDLLDQERKLAQSGLGELFDGVEIVSDKTRPVYEGIFHRHGHGASAGMMIGNSMKSDVVPMVQAGGWGVHVPHGLEWETERADPPVGAPRFVQLQDLGGLRAQVDLIEQAN
jgi:putative hydrolase of the HAD superfamily